MDRMDLFMQCDILVLDDLRKEEPFNLLISKWDEEARGLKIFLIGKFGIRP